LVGISLNVQRIVTRAEGEEMANRMNAEYWEASAKFNENVRELFERLAAVLFERSLIHALSSKNETTEIGKLSKSIHFHSFDSARH
jgi:hypothetical protein